ncbi:MAG: sulfotransferase [bacterium]
MNGVQLLDIYPKQIIEEADEKRLDKLAGCRDEDEFRRQLENFARRSYPIWIFGVPRTGSSWLIKYFYGEIFSPVFNEPWDLVQCSSVEETETKINCRGENSFYERPVLMQKLGLVNCPSDRLALAVNRRFVFKYLFDFNIVPSLMKIYPRSRFVWITRDARDQIESFYNPEQDHWPQTKFKFLGEEPRERFLGATLRFVNFTQRQFKIVPEYSRRIIKIKYEEFTENFKVQAGALLNFSGISIEQKKLEELASDFKARHGMWKNWETWQKQVYLDSGAGELNQILGYDCDGSDADNVWEQSRKNSFYHNHAN